MSRTNTLTITRVRIALRDGSEADASGSAREENVQAAEPSLPDAARARSLHERGAQRHAMLEGGLAAAAS